MADFIVRARAAPVDPGQFRAARGAGLGVEYLADIIRQGLFISKDHRADAVLHLVLEKSSDFSRVVTISGDDLGSLPDLHEAGLLEFLAKVLEAGRKLEKEASADGPGGTRIRAISFEKLVRDFTENRSVYVLHPDGRDIRDTDLDDDPVFVMTDHTPMPRNTYKSMSRQGVHCISLGPAMLHASQCLVLIHNEMDRRGLNR